MRIWARKHLPVSIQARLKAWESRSLGGSAGRRMLIARQDGMIQLMEQRIESLESSVFSRFDQLEAALVERETRLISRQDHILTLFEQKLESLEQMMLAQIKDSHSDPLLSDEQYSRLQEAYHNPQEKEVAYRSMIERWIAEDAFVLDLGCGAGGLMRVLQETGRETCGVDTSPAMVEACRKQNLNVVESDAVTYLTTLERDSFDAVTCLHVVEHLPNRALADLVRESFRVLRPGGVLVIETPKVASLYDLTQYYFIDPTHRLPRHHALLRFLCEDVGFGDVIAEDVPTGETTEKLRLEFDDLIESEDSTAEDAGDEAPLPEVVPPGESDDHGGVQVETMPVRTRIARAQEDRLRERLAGLIGALNANFTVLNEWLFVPRDVRIVAKKAIGDPAEGGTETGEPNEAAET